MSLGGNIPQRTGLVLIHTMGLKKDSMGHLGTHSDWKGLILSRQTKVVSLLVSNGLILSGRKKAPPPRG